MVSTYPSERRARNGAVTAATIPSTSSSQAAVAARSSQPQQIDRSHSGTTVHKEIGAVIEHTHDIWYMGLGQSESQDLCSALLLHIWVFRCASVSVFHHQSL